MRIPDEARTQLAVKFAVLLPHLDERQRRLLMAAEARVPGHGGVRVVAQSAAVSETTVRKGVFELEAGEEPLGRVRRPGGGRKRVADLDPGLRPALLALVEPDVRGDPMSSLRWTVKSTRTLARELTRAGHRVSAAPSPAYCRRKASVCRANAKTIEGSRPADRDARFRCLNEQAREHRDTGQPVISVDTRKKELVGDFKNHGRQWRPAGDPVPVHVHDFADLHLGNEALRNSPARPRSWRLSSSRSSPARAKTAGPHRRAAPPAVTPPTAPVTVPPTPTGDWRVRLRRAW